MRPSSALCLLAALFFLSPREHKKFIVVDEFGSVVFSTHDESDARDMAVRLSKSYDSPSGFYVFQD